LDLGKEGEGAAQANGSGGLGIREGADIVDLVALLDMDGGCEEGEEGWRVGFSLGWVGKSWR